MRILLVSEDIPYPSMGGLAKHVLTLARTLARAGHQVDLLGGTQHPLSAAGEEADFGGRFFGELDGHLANWKEVKLGMYNPLRRTWVARRFARIIMRHAADYDVVHYHGHFPNVARYISKHVNFVQTRHDQGSDCLLDTRFRNGQICSATDPASCAGCRTDRPNALQKTVSTIAVKRYRSEVADAFERHKTIFVSDMLHRNLKRTLGERQWGAVVHNFADLSAIRRARAAAAERQDPRFHVFVAGKLYPVKGIEAFLRELAPRMLPNMRVTVAGDGGDGPRLRAEFEGKQVAFAGWCSPQQTLNLAASADAVIVPSLWEEAFGSTTLEGLLLGKPTFALNRGATPELVMYASGPEQLRLHSDMSSLVQDLLAYSQRPRAADYQSMPEESASAEHAVMQLLDIYRLPPGNAIN